MKKCFCILSVACIVLMSFQYQMQENEPTNKIALGEKLFFDPILSSKKTLSCASCHKPALAFADTTQFSVGVDGILTDRNTPSAMNLAGRIHLFWDGRSNSLEEQAIQPIISTTEMNLPIVQALSRLNEDKVYSRAFKKIYKSQATEKLLGDALAAYQKTLETANTPYDRYINGDDNAMSPEAIRGRLLFIGKANCANCHAGEDFTADRFKNIGLFDGRKLNDVGRYKITKDSSHLGHFKVPGLRNVAITPPYMHNGVFKTLKEVIEYYNQPDAFVKNGLNRDLSLSTPLGLSKTEITELEAFLNALTDDRFLKK